jgi:hypothetical protein
MRNLILNNYVIFVFLVTTIASCEKKEAFPLKEMNKASISSIAPSHIKTAAIGLLELSKSAQFRTLVNSEVRRHFDDDDNVLLRVLDSLMYNNLPSLFENSIQLHNAGSIKAINSVPFTHYNDIDNIRKSIRGIPDGMDTAYLQIYIPYFEQTDTSLTPIIVPVFKETLTDCYLGYKFSNNGILDSITVSEAIAKGYPIWAIYVNETVNNGGLLPQVINNINASYDRGNANYIQFTDIKVSDAKESWINGKAEISWVGAQQESCVVNEPLSGVWLLKVKKKKLNEWISVKNCNLRWLASGSAPTPQVSGEFIEYVFFEKDPSNEDNQKQKTTSCGNTLYFFSEQSAYGISGEIFNPLASNIWTALPQTDLKGISIKAERKGN